MNRISSLSALLLLWCLHPLHALDFNLSIQPILPKQQIVRAYQPLANYLSAQTGHNIRIAPHNNFITYWAEMRDNKGFDLVLDAAHFTDYRTSKLGYEVLAKLPDTASFAIVTHEDNFVFDVEELVLKRVATLVSPGVGAIRLAELFSNPIRQPRMVYVDNANEAARMVSEKRVFAAIIPTALVSSFDGLNTVVTTESLPHMAFSASPNVPPEVKQKISQALIDAQNTPQGRDMLTRINFPAFESADDEVYRGYERLLRNVLGY